MSTRSDLEAVPCDACCGAGCPVCSFVGFFEFDPETVRRRVVRRDDKFRKMAMMRKLPDGRLEVIGEVCSAEDWRDQWEAAAAALNDDDGGGDDEE